MTWVKLTRRGWCITGQYLSCLVNIQYLGKVLKIIFFVRRGDGLISEFLKTGGNKKSKKNQVSSLYCQQIQTRSQIHNLVCFKHINWEFSVTHFLISKVSIFKALFFGKKNRWHKSYFKWKKLALNLAKQFRFPKATLLFILWISVLEYCQPISNGCWTLVRIMCINIFCDLKDKSISIFQQLSLESWYDTFQFSTPT